MLDQIILRIYLALGLGVGNDLPSLKAPFEEFNFTRSVVIVRAGRRNKDVHSLEPSIDLSCCLELAWRVGENAVKQKDDSVWLWKPLQG